MKQLTKSFLWRTMEGEILTLAEMDTKHIFNSMKMIFNHLAQEFNAQPVWFNHRYSDYQHSAARNPEGLAWQVLVFIAEIESRGDLSTKYAEPYQTICEQVFGPMRLKRISEHTEEIGGEV